MPRTNAARTVHQVKTKLALAAGLGLALTAATGAARADDWQPVNLALHKPAVQSSTLFEAYADRAVDGIADASWWGNSVTHTDADAHSWWQVDLGEVRQIGRIEIVNRIDCCSERIVPFMVIVADIPLIDADMTDSDAALFSRITRTTISGPVQSSYAVPINRSGRYVRIALANQNYLSLAEVRVLEATNAARGRIATASSSRSGGDPAHAVDGNTNGVFNDYSVASTNVEFRPWWEVDLGYLQNINQIDVWSTNTDCCSTLNPRPGFYVWISRTPITASPITNPHPDARGFYVPAQGAPAVMRPSPSLLGRYVRIELDATDSLSLAEVQVWPVARGAVGGHAKLSTTEGAGDANYAIDMNATTTPWAQSKSQMEPYLDVDLGAVRYIETVRLWTNPNALPISYRVFASYTDFKNGSTPVTTVAGTLALPDVSNWLTHGTPTYGTTVVMRQARFVRIMLDGQAQLTVPEIEIATTEGVATGYQGRNGAVTGSNPPTTTRNLHGYYPRPNVSISVYAFRPGIGYEWFGATTSATTPTLIASAPTPVYEFSAPAVTMPSGTFPVGGVGGLFYQANDDLGAFIPLRSLDDDGSENVFWPDTRLTAMSPSPDDMTPRPQYLNLPLGTTLRPKYITDGNYAIPPTFANFTSKFFTGRATVSVSYYNAGELGLGRKVTCARGSIPWKTGSKDGTACTVEEYAPLDGAGKPIFGDEAGALNALATGRPYSISAIVTYDKLQAGAGGEIWFGSYKETTPGQSFTRSQSSDLDSAKHNTTVPNNCLACHGGNASFLGSQYPSQLTNGYLLPLDVSSFSFPTWAPLETQTEQFRKLNAMVLTQKPTQQIADYVNGSYANTNGVNTPGATPDLNWIPAGWNKTPGQIKVYDKVIKPFCRACHNSQISPSGVTFLKATDAENMRALIVSEVCTTKRMPHAQQTLKQFWRSGARAQLLGFFGRHDYAGEACTP